MIVLSRLSHMVDKKIEMKTLNKSFENKFSRVVKLIVRWAMDDLKKREKKNGKYSFAMMQFR